ncbi:MAG TPA: hypothetical protein VF688_07850 [Allosphingosinicella sp.]
MDAISTLLRLGFAACLSAAVAGSLLAVALFFGARLDEPLTGWASIGSAGLAELGSLAAFGITTGIVVASVPAFLAGAALWGMSRYERHAGHAFAWAAAGAAVGALLWALLELTFWTPGRGARLTYVDAGFFLACLIAGTGGALAFRTTMKCTAFMEE